MPAKNYTDWNFVLCFKKIQMKKCASARVTRGITDVSEKLAKLTYELDHATRGLISIKS